MYEVGSVCSLAFCEPSGVPVPVVPRPLYWGDWVHNFTSPEMGRGGKRVGGLSIGLGCPRSWCTSYQRSHGPEKISWRCDGSCKQIVTWFFSDWTGGEGNFVKFCFM